MLPLREMGNFRITELVRGGGGGRQDWLTYLPPRSAGENAYSTQLVGDDEAGRDGSALAGCRGAGYGQSVRSVRKNSGIDQQIPANIRTTGTIRIDFADIGTITANIGSTDRNIVNRSGDRSNRRVRVQSPTAECGGAFERAARGIRCVDTDARGTRGTPIGDREGSGRDRERTVGRGGGNAESVLTIGQLSGIQRVAPVDRSIDGGRSIRSRAVRIAVNRDGNAGDFGACADRSSREISHTLIGTTLSAWLSNGSGSGARLGRVRDGERCSGCSTHSVFGRSGYLNGVLAVGEGRSIE
jgi:hypothetical protein